MADSGSLAAREAVLEGIVHLVSESADPVTVAAAWKGVGVAEVTYWSNSLLIDLVRIKFGTDAAKLTHADTLPRLQRLAGELELSELFGVLDAATRARLSVVRHSSLNEQLLLEELAIAWQPGIGPASRELGVT